MPQLVCLAAGHPHPSLPIRCPSSTRWPPAAWSAYPLLPWLVKVIVCGHDYLRYNSYLYSNQLMAALRCLDELCGSMNGRL